MTKMLTIDLPEDAYVLPEKESVKQDIAYIKQEIRHHRAVWIVYDADGCELAQTLNRETAFIVVQENDLEAISVH